MSEKSTYKRLQSIWNDQSPYTNTILWRLEDETTSTKFLKNKETSFTRIQSAVGPLFKTKEKYFLTVLESGQIET